VNARWQTLSPPVRVAIAIVAAVVVVNLGVSALNSITGGGPGGPASSSYATSADGLAAYADLLAAQGVAVTRLRVPIERARLAPGSTVVIVDDPVSSDELAGLRQLLSAGGRVVLAGELAAPVLNHLLAKPVRWIPTGETVGHPAEGQTDLQGVRTVHLDGEGSWAEAGSARPLLDGGSRFLAIGADVGPGRVVALADPSPLRNRLLAEADNAALAVDLASPSGRPVAFAEYGHGYGQRSGFGALPGPWQHALELALLAVVFAMWAKGKRLGPPERAGFDLPPARVVYVEAVAASLARTGDRHAAVAPLRAEARARLLARTGLPADADDAELARAAIAAGVDAAVVGAVVASVVQTDDDVLAIGRARMEVEDRRW
jgi:hypothetical protein